jgi:hypothetical protein
MVPLVMQFVFSASYLKELDLRKNNLTAEGIKVVMEQLTMIEGVTKVEGPPQLDQEIRASSGNQLRMTVYVGQQTIAPPDSKSQLVLDEDLNVTAADEFLTQAGGIVGGSSVKPLKPPQQGTSLAATASPTKSGALSQTASAPLLGADASQPTLPKLDLSRGGPKKPPAPPIAGGPGPPGSGSHRSFGSGGSSRRR